MMDLVGVLLSKHAIAPIAETQPICPLPPTLRMRDCGQLLRALRIADGHDYLASERGHFEGHPMSAKLVKEHLNSLIHLCQR
jgi:hypothetical protein